MKSSLTLSIRCCASNLVSGDTLAMVASSKRPYLVYLNCCDKINAMN